jgi:hypothetical protein
MAAELEERVAALEGEIARLKDSLRGGEANKPWWEYVHGLFAEDPDFDEAVRLGREYRESLRTPPPESREN